MATKKFKTWRGQTIKVDWVSNRWRLHCHRVSEQWHPVYSWPTRPINTSELNLSSSHLGRATLNTESCRKTRVQHATVTHYCPVSSQLLYWTMQITKSEATSFARHLSNTQAVQRKKKQKKTGHNRIQSDQKLSKIKWNTNRQNTMNQSIKDTTEKNKRVFHSDLKVDKLGVHLRLNPDRRVNGGWHSTVVTCC